MAPGWRPAGRGDDASGVYGQQQSFPHYGTSAIGRNTVRSQPADYIDMYTPPVSQYYARLIADSLRSQRSSGTAAALGGGTAAASPAATVGSVRASSSLPRASDASTCSWPTTRPLSEAKFSAALGASHQGLTPRLVSTTPASRPISSNTATLTSSKLSAPSSRSSYGGTTNEAQRSIDDYQKVCLQEAARTTRRWDRHNGPNKQ